MTLLCAGLLLTGAVALLLEDGEPPHTEPAMIYLAALHEAREEFPARPWWQQFLAGGLSYEDHENEILRVFESIRHPGDPLLEVQYAISLLEFGRTADALRVLEEIVDPDYDATVSVLRGLAARETSQLLPEDVEYVEWLIGESESWWSHKLAEMLVNEGLMEDAASPNASAVLWEKSVWMGGLEWSLLFLLAGLVWRLRSSLHMPVYAGVASGFGANADNSALLAAMLRAIVLFLLLSVAGYLIVYFLFEDPLYAVLALVDVLCRMMPAGLFLLWFFPSWRISVRALGLELRWLRRASTWVWVCLGLLVTSAGSWLLWIGADRLGGVDPSDFVDVALAGGGWEVLVYQLFVAGILAPVSEELIFRGVLFRTWARRYGPWAGACLSSAVFSIIHFYSPLGLVSVFLSGMIFAWVTQRTGSLWPAVLIHAIGNMMATWMVWWFFSSVWY